MADLSKRVMKGEIKVRNIQDFERLVKLDLLLMGEPTDRSEIAGSKDVELSPADKERLDEIAKLLGEFK